MSRFALLATATLPPGSAQGQASPTVVRGESGAELRYLGDTIWQRRENGTTRAVYRSDTVFLAHFVDERLASAATYVLLDGAARIVERRDESGAVHRTPQSFQLTSAGAALRNYNALLLALQFDSFLRLRAAGPTSLIPRSPATPITYVTRAGMTAVHHGDTVRVASGCPGVPVRDTLVWVLMGTDSVRRLSKPPVTYNRIVADNLLLELAFGVLTSRFRETTLFRTLPGPPRGTCDSR